MIVAVVLVASGSRQWTQARARHDAETMAKAASIEDHFHAIEQAVAALDSGELPLEEALKRYEQGLVAVRQAKVLLDRFQARLDELRAVEPKTEPKSEA